MTVTTASGATYPPGLYDLRDHRRTGPLLVRIHAIGEGWVRHDDGWHYLSADRLRGVLEAHERLVSRHPQSYEGPVLIPPRPREE